MAVVSRDVVGTCGGVLVFDLTKTWQAPLECWQGKSYNFPLQGKPHLSTP